MTDTKEQEVWKQYPEFNFIEVSNLGEVRTKDRIVTCSNGRKQFVKGRVLKQSDNGRGYMYVRFKVNGKPIYRYVHRIMGISFLPNPNNLPEVNHIDCNPKNNRLENVEWCSSRYNIAYRERFGVSARDATKVLRHPVFVVDLKTSKVLRFNSQHEAARQLGISQQNINSVINGRAKTADGYWFTEDESEITEEKIREIKAGMYFLGGVIAVNLDNFEVLYFESQSEAERQLGVDQTSISRVVRGKQRRTGGYWFCDADKNVVEKARTKFGDGIANKVEKLMNANRN